MEMMIAWKSISIEAKLISGASCVSSTPSMQPSSAIFEMKPSEEFDARNVYRYNAMSTKCGHFEHQTLLKASSRKALAFIKTAGSVPPVGMDS